MRSGVGRPTYAIGAKSPDTLGWPWERPAAPQTVYGLGKPHPTRAPPGPLMASTIHRTRLSAGSPIPLPLEPRAVRLTPGGEPVRREKYVPTATSLDVAVTGDVLAGRPGTGLTISSPYVSDFSVSGESY